MVLMINARGEIEDAGSARQTIITEGQGPKTLDGYRVAFVILQLTEEVAGSRIKGIDTAVTKVADEQVFAELAKIGRGQSQAPRRIERPLRCEAPNQSTGGIEDIHKSIARA